jgi:predicted molibdopterin-dependent oxidoreductase YjgC
MQITINNIQVEIRNGETIMEAAQRMGYTIPSMCYAKGAKHKSSCMVCAVKNNSNGQILPSCTTLPTDGMQIDTESEEVKTIRILSLELLLSDHRADCEAPCSMACPHGLDVERMLSFYDINQYEKAYRVISTAFYLPEVGCDNCKAPCEKVCRRAKVDQAVSVREVIRKIIGMFDSASSNGEKQLYKTDKSIFRSHLGKFTEEERERLKKTVTVASLCLHCACAGRTECKLRHYATVEGIKRPRYHGSSLLPIMAKQQISENMWFEQAKCIRCGLCVYNSENGFTFKDRGFGMQVVLPEENRANIKEELATLCPTGAIYKIQREES